MARITGSATLGFAHYTLYQALPSLARIGFKTIEITSFNGYCFHFNYGSPETDEIAGLLEKYGMKAVSMNYSAGGYDASDIKEIDRFVSDWTKKIKQLPELGIKMLTMGFGFRNTGKDEERQLYNAVAAYDIVGEIAKQYDVRMLLEVPHLYNIMNRPSQVLWVFDRLKSDNVGALLDSSHWGIIGYDLEKFINDLDGRVWHIHLRDSKGSDTADFKQELELTPGKGTVDFVRFGEVLDKCGYKGDVMLDFEYRDMTIEGIVEEYRQGLENLRDSGWELPEGVDPVWHQKERVSWK